MTTLKEQIKESLGMEKEGTAQRHQHLVPHDKGWALKQTGANRPSFVFEKKTDAMQKAVTVARRQKTVLVIHGRDGRVQEQRDYT